jgi:hypothetical protein
MDFLPVDEQLDYLQKGAAEIIRVSDLQERLEAFPENRPAYAREGGL